MAMKTTRTRRQNGDEYQRGYAARGAQMRGKSSDLIRQLDFQPADFPRVIGTLAAAGKITPYDLHEFVTSGKITREDLWAAKQLTRSEKEPWQRMTPQARRRRVAGEVALAGRQSE